MGILKECKFVPNMERSDFYIAPLLLFEHYWDISGVSLSKETQCLLANTYERKWIKLKEISKEGIEKLIKAGYLKNTDKGYVDSNGRTVGYYRTKGSSKKRYIEDKFCHLAERGL